MLERHRRTWAPALALAALAAACGGEGEGGNEPASAGADPAGERPRAENVLLITLDTTRADAITCMGGPAGVTPNLDALASEGVLYENARTVTPITLPSHASMLTGLYPPRHTVRVNSVNALPASARTAAEAASARGIETAAFVATIVLASDFGLAQGFDVYDQPPPPPRGIAMPGQVGRRSADAITNAFKSWYFGRDADAPFLAWVHLYDPHFPYDQENPFRAEIPGDGYHAEVAAADYAVGEILAAVKTRGALEDTLVIVVADHGEGRGDHGEDTHSALIYESTMHVPMIVRFPDGARAGERSDEIVSVVDVYPTILEALGLPVSSVPGGLDGISLYSRRAPADRGVYMESFYGLYSFEWSALAGWADADGKLLRSSKPELYDVADDPREQRDLAAARAADVPGYVAEIDAVLAAPALERDDSDVAGALVAESLRGLGYTGTAPADGSAPISPFSPERPPPAARMNAFRLFVSTDDMSTVESTERAIAVLQQILAENERNHSAWLQLSGALLNVRRYAEAEQAARKAVEIGGERYTPVKNVAIALDAQERFAEAVPFYERAVELAPGDTTTIQRLASIFAFLGNEERAQHYARMLTEGR